MKDWKGNEIPSKGWIYEDYYYMGSIYESRSNMGLSYETCRVCGNRRTRFLHALRHPDCPDLMLADRACAEKLTGDNVTPSKNEGDILEKEMKDPDWLLHECLSSLEGE